MTRTIVGIDWATQPKNVGLARARREDGRFRVTDLMRGNGKDDPVKVVTRWLDNEETALLALDAPLGWPVSLGRELVGHRAGDPIETCPKDLFRRLTDREVKRRVDKVPLEVGADRIARTAHSALRFLAKVRTVLGEPVPLAWRTPLAGRIEAIEVYPAATLLARSADLKGYKKPDAILARIRLFDILRESCDCDVVRQTAIGSHDCLDALACVVAGVDFLAGTVIAPREDELEVAEREGWIWFRAPAGRHGDEPGGVSVRRGPRRGPAKISDAPNR